jgi:hypothetical protein
MARPIILTTSSILGYLQHQEFEFQPYAVNTPTAWTSSVLPDGVTLDDETGLISGAAAKPGVYNVALRAENGDGTSDPVIFTFGIEASVADPDANVVDLELDLGTRQVTRLGAAERFLYTAKLDDDVIFRIQMKRNGIPAAVTLTSLKVAIKELEPEAVLSEGDDFDDLGEGVFLLYLPVAGDPLKSALSNYEDDKATLFPAITEIEWVANNPLTVGPATVRGSSRHFEGQIVRDVIPS